MINETIYNRLGRCFICLLNKIVKIKQTKIENKKIIESPLLIIVFSLANINYIRQKEPKGLGHAIYKAKAFVGNEPFAVLLGDDIVRSKEPCIGQMIKQYEKTLSSVIGIKEVEPMEVSSYGIIDGKIVQDRLYKIKTMVEKPNPENAPTNLAVIGRYIINPEIFECIERTKPGKNNEIQLTDALALLLEKQSIYGYEFVGKRYDVGNKVGYLKATVEFALEMEEIKDEFAKYCRTLIDKL